MAINMFNILKKKDKNPPIKHKLWGKLKYEAKTNWRIVTSKNNYDFDGAEQYYDVEFWCVDEYMTTDCFSHITLEQAKKIVNEEREAEFYKLCKNVLSSRRNAKIRNL